MEPTDYGVKHRKLLMQEMRPMPPLSLRVQLRVPPLNMATVREYIHTATVVENYCDACTLREGTIVTMLILQTVSAASVCSLVAMLEYFPDATEFYWREKFTADFDPYLVGEHKEFITSLWEMWKPIYMTLIITESSYFGIGLGVVYALMKKTAHPAWYIPWILMTAIMVAITFIISFILFVFNCIVGTYRYISVTWDIFPMILTFLYACFWHYCLITVVAHYKRRRIVKYWRDARKFTGGNNF